MKSIYYCASGAPSAGGQHVNVEHVIALRQKGLRAYLLYVPATSEIKHFETAAPTLLMTKEMGFTQGDVVVVPEPWEKLIRYFAQKPCLKVIHCQNPHYLFHSFQDVRAIAEAGYQQMLSCSGYTTEMLRRFGYYNPVHTVRPAIAAEFRPGAVSKALQIAYMPRKRAIEATFVQGIFRSLYPQYRDIPWIPIQGVNRQAVAEVMQISSVFAAFGFIEGLGLPPLEAMACGCIVAGFDGQGGADYSQPGNGFWAAEGDYFGFAHQLAKAIEASQLPIWRQEIEENCSKILVKYTEATFKTDLANAWKTILGDRYREFLLDAG